MIYLELRSAYRGTFQLGVVLVKLFLCIPHLYKYNIYTRKREIKNYIRLQMFHLNQSTLQNHVCQLLSELGVTVKAVDLSHCHRNSKKPHKVTTNDGKSKTLPPSITVSFVKSSKKDSVIKSYQGLDANKQGGQVADE